MGRAFAGIAVLVALASACRTPVAPPATLVAGLTDASRIYTLANLHPDPKTGKLSAANYQTNELIPVCSEVVLVRAYPDSLEFQVGGAGRVYEFLDDEASGEPFSQNLARYFGRACPEAEVAALSELDREGVRRGIAALGMSRPAVLLALGYPPRSDTRTLELPAWLYWVDDERNFLVAFDDDGKVEVIHR